MRMSDAPEFLARQEQEDRDALEADPGWEHQAMSGPVLSTLTRIVELYTPITPERIAELRRMDYRIEYLKTPEWRFTRDSAVAAVGHRCQRCNRYGDPLDVHHLTYERLGEELATDLAVLCRSCHERQHEREGS